MTLKRIIIHWTAGSWQPNQTDLEHYHYLITGDGKVISGKYKPEDNVDCYDGRYSAHTGGGNTGSIGVAFCSMLKYKSPDDPGAFPIRKIQFEAGMKFIADLCKKYKLAISQETVMTHRTFGILNPKTSSRGKIDICYLPCHPEIKTEEIEDFVRGKILWYYSKK